MSYLAFYFAYQEKTSIEGCFDLCVKKYKKSVEEGNLKLPSLLVFLDTPTNFAIKNMKKREEKGANKLPQYWYEKSFIRNIKKAYKSMCDTNSIESLTLDGRNLEDNKRTIINTWSSLTPKRQDLEFFKSFKKNLEHQNGNS